jgi:hypothetical protein
MKKVCVPASGDWGKTMTSKTISADFPFESKYVEVHGSKMHYIDEGVILIVFKTFHY